jgi:hypothetical protein
MRYIGRGIAGSVSVHLTKEGESLVLRNRDRRINLWVETTYCRAFASNSITELKGIAAIGVSPLPGSTAFVSVLKGKKIATGDEWSMEA